MNCKGRKEKDDLVACLISLAVNANFTLQDVAYKPQEFYVQTRKCEPNAGEDVVKTCERQECHSFQSFLNFSLILY